MEKIGYTQGSKKANLKPKPKKTRSLGLEIVLGLGFGLVCTPLGKNIVGTFIWSY